MLLKKPTRSFETTHGSSRNPIQSSPNSLSLTRTKLVGYPFVELVQQLKAKPGEVKLFMIWLFLTQSKVNWVKFIID